MFQFLIAQRTAADSLIAIMIQMRLNQINLTKIVNYRALTHIAIATYSDTHFNKSTPLKLRVRYAVRFPAHITPDARVIYCTRHTQASPYMMRLYATSTLFPPAARKNNNAKPYQTSPWIYIAPQQLPPYNHRSCAKPISDCAIPQTPPNHALARDHRLHSDILHN